MVETSAVLYHPLSHAPDPRAESVSAVCEFALGHPLMDEEQQWGSSNPAEASASQTSGLAMKSQYQRCLEISANYYGSEEHSLPVAGFAVEMEAEVDALHFRY